MNDDKKAAPKSNKFALITVHPWLPSRDEQVARARAWGVEESWLGKDDVSALIVDDVSKVKRTTNWPGKLVARARFFEVMRALAYPGVQVFFANPLCVGFSEHHARQTVDAAFAIGLEVYVHTVKDNGSALYRQGDDMSEFFEAVGLMANAAHQRAHRARQS